MFWPNNLAVAYSHPGKLPIWQTACETALLVVTTFWVFALRKRMPYLITGWLWYLVMLLPVLGFLQVGAQAHADRYTYLPQIGLYLAITWGVADFCKHWPYRKQALGAISVIIIGALGSRAADQVRYWRTGEALWRHALAIDPQNQVAHIGLAGFLANRERFDQAIAEYETAIRIGGPNPDLETTLANLLLEHGTIEETIRYYRDVVRQQPTSALAHYNLAVGLHRVGNLSEAIVHYKEALAIQQDYPDADRFLGEALLQNGQPDEAQLHLKKR